MMFIGLAVCGTITRPLTRDWSTMKLPVTLVLLLTMFPRGPQSMGPTDLGAPFQIVIVNIEGQLIGARGAQTVDVTSHLEIPIGSSRCSRRSIALLDIDLPEAAKFTLGFEELRVVKLIFHRADQLLHEDILSLFDLLIDDPITSLRRISLSFQVLPTEHASSSMTSEVEGYECEREYKFRWHSLL